MAKVLFILLLGILLNGVAIGARINVCSGFCDDPHVAFEYCTDSRSCFERVRGNQIIEVFADNQVNCYRETSPSFPAYIKNISASVHNETLSVSITWQWPAMDVTDYSVSGDYKATWGLQYVITVPGEIRSKCYTLYPSKERIQQGRITIPCTKFEDGGFSQSLEFNVTSLAFMTEKFKMGSSFIPSRLQEITVKTGQLGSASSVSIWNPQMNYTFSGHVLTVSFIPAPVSLGHTSYEVHIYKAEESRCIPGASYVDKVDTVPHWPTTVVNFSTKSYAECSKYCIGLHPVRNSPQSHCSEGCVTEMRDVLLVEVPSQILKCKHWNASFGFKMDPFKNKTTVFFDVFPEYSFCFENFIMYLVKPWESECTGMFTKVKSKAFQWNSSVSAVTFKNLEHAKYCVKVYPDHVVCRTKNRDLCPLRYSDVQSLAATPEAAASSMKTPNPPVFNQVMMISVVSVIGVVVLLTIGGILWWKLRPNARQLKMHVMDEPMWPLVDTDEPREIVIVYAHDKKTRKRVRALSNFLKHCRHYKVFLVEDHRASISLGNPCFVTEILSFSCPQYTKSTCYSEIKRIIVVKSRRALKLFRKREITMKRIYEELDEKFFCPAVTSIPSLTDSVMDTCHVFVVQFGDAVLPDSETFKLLTPWQRYFLPEQLGQLCLNLHRIDHPTDDIVRARKINEMHQQWEEHESYRKLYEVCR